MSNFNHELVKRLTDADKRLERLESRQSPIKRGTDVTIASGVITASRPYHRLHPESGTTDDIDTITPPYDSKFLLLHSYSATYSITVKDGTGNIDINGDCTLSDPTHTLYLMYDDNIEKWVEVSRSQVGGKQYATYVIAANDTTDEGKAGADQVCDGTADQVTINAAFAAATPSTYMRVELLEGTYNLAGPIVMIDDSVLSGQEDGTILSPSANSISCIVAATNCTIANLKLHSLSTTSTTGIEAIGETDVKIDNITVVGFPSFGFYASTATNKVHFYNCRFYDNGKNTYGIYVDTCHHIQIVNCYFDDCDEGVWLDTSNFSAIVGCKFVGCGYGVDVGGSNTLVEANHCYNCGSVGINVYDGDFLTIDGNVLYWCDQGIALDTITRSLVNSNVCNGDGSSIGSTGIDLSASNYNIISDNVCTDFSSEGILIDASSHNRIGGNHVTGNSWSSSSNPALNNTAGIGLVNNSDSNFISGNIARKSSPGSSNFQSYAVRISSSNCDSNLIVNNDFRNGGNLAEVLNSGTTTTIVNIDGSTPQRTLTLATDAVTVTGSGYYTILPQSGTADDMITINGFSDGMIIYVRAETASHVITIKETGNIALVNSQFRMVGREDFITLIYDADQSKWIELSRSITNTGLALTIASGVVTIQKDYHTLTPETGAVDDLTTINGGVDGQLLIVQPGATYTVTLKDGTGNLDLGGDFEMIDTDDKIIILTYNAASNTWIELYRSGVGDVADGSVTFAKMQDISADRLLGRDTTGTGPITQISLNATLEFTGGDAIQRAALTGDVTATAGSNTTSIPNDTVTFAKMQNVADSTIAGRAVGAGTGDITALTAAQVLTILGLSSSLHTFTSFTANTAGGADTTLDSYTVPAGKLAADGDSIWFEAWGTFASNGNSKTLKVHFGSSGVFVIWSQSSTLSGVDWEIKGRIMRISATSQMATVSIIAGTSASANYTSGLDQTLSGTVGFSIIGASSGSGDIILQGDVIGYTAAP
jgi:parallel beta-helix repeat protein